MSKQKTRSSTEGATLPTHGCLSLPRLDVDSYSLELEDETGFAGDRANKGAFIRILDELRKPLAKLGQDPLGSKRSDEISRKKLAAILVEGDPNAAALVHGAVEQFAQELQAVIGRFLKLETWRDTEAIAVGGGLSGSRIGELCIARAGILLKADGLKIDLEPIRHDPDEAGLIGAAHLIPIWMIEGHDAMLAADIGGTNIRVGIVALNLAKANDLSKASIVALEHWCHQDERELTREETVDHLIDMLTRMADVAHEKGLRLAPLVGIGCPGMIRQDGSIEGGAQNLPGNWESGKFNLPRCIQQRMPRFGEHDTNVILHNDAVVQGLSQIPYMHEREHWGILTIGTGLGNARFSNRQNRKKKRA